MKQIIFFSFICFSIFNINKAVCQSTTPKLILSPYFDYNFLDLNGKGIVYNKNAQGLLYSKYNVYAGEGNQNMDGFRIGVVAEHHWRNKIFTYRLNYYGSSGFVTILNLHPEEDAYMGQVTNSFIESYYFKRIEGGFGIDLLKFRKLSFGLGLLGFFQFKDPYAKVDDSAYNNPAYPWEKQYQILSNVAQSYLSFSTAVRFNMKYRFGPVVLDCGFEKSITPISKTITFNGITSPWVQNFKSFSLGFSYDILILPRPIKK